jgi:hypothetical protein
MYATRAFSGLACLPVFVQTYHGSGGRVREDWARLLFGNITYLPPVGGRQQYLTSPPYFLSRLRELPACSFVLLPFWYELRMPAIPCREFQRPDLCCCHMLLQVSLTRLEINQDTIAPFTYLQVRALHFWSPQGGFRLSPLPRLCKTREP